MPTAIDLPRAIATTPNLSGAACVNHRDVFDACLLQGTRPQTYAKAIRVCV